MTWTREDLSWAAGLFEGEGSIHLGKHHKKWQARLQMQMTDLDVMKRFQAIVGGPEIRGPYQYRAENKPIYQWATTRQELVQAIIVALWPWLGERRREQAKLALRSLLE